MATNVTTSKVPVWLSDAYASASKYAGELYESGSKHAGDFYAAGSKQAKAAYEVSSKYANEAYEAGSKHYAEVAQKVSTFWNERALPIITSVITKLRTGYGISGICFAVGVVALYQAFDRRENNYCVKVTKGLFACACFAAAGYAFSFKAVPLI